MEKVLDWELGGLESTEGLLELPRSDSFSQSLSFHISSY